MLGEGEEEGERKGGDVPARVHGPRWPGGRRSPRQDTGSEVWKSARSPSPRGPGRGTALALGAPLPPPKSPRDGESRARGAAPVTPGSPGRPELDALRPQFHGTPSFSPRRPDTTGPTPRPAPNWPGRGGACFYRGGGRALRVTGRRANQNGSCPQPGHAHSRPPRGPRSGDHLTRFRGKEGPL